MNQQITEQIRLVVDSKNWPLDCNKWPEELQESTNCLSFALGLPISDKDHKLFNSEEAHIKDELVKFFDIMNLQWREIVNIQDAKDDEFIIQGYEFWQIIGGDDFHVVRRELNGEWVHKPGWKYVPETIKNLNDLHCHMHPRDITCIFAVKKSTS